MPSTAGDLRWLRRFARLLLYGLALAALGRLIDPDHP